ncbi:DUF6357 family protein [Microbacterium sp. Marseille-Q6965]|uniref:DUF6357 family protein n=1 Tax=Microbacterium sp. Marseille-Q6965 TaxID=2965072 RepID=UPI0021B7B220|nr:DUF6357 family protein [Microbacterium sp. Marseille-Q6965]
MRRYEPGPRQFLLGDGGGREQQCSADDAQQAYDAFRAFFDELRADGATMLSIEDPAAEEGLALMLGSGVAVRIRGGEDARTEYSRVEPANRFGAFAMRFFEGGFDGLSFLGEWYAEAAELDASPEDRGERRAAAASTEREALDEVLAIWHDAGYIDPSDRYYVFFDSHTLAEPRADRAALLTLIEKLGLQRVDPPAGATEGEVWVLRDPRIDAELESRS